MALNIRIDDGDLVVLSNIARLMNDPRYASAPRDLDPFLDAGRRRFALELAGVHDTGSALLGLLMTLTRRIRKAGADLVLIRPSPALRTTIEEMRLDDYWEILPDLAAARHYYGPPREEIHHGGTEGRGDDPTTS